MARQPRRTSESGRPINLALVDLLLTGETLHPVEARKRFGEEAYAAGAYNVWLELDPEFDLAAEWRRHRGWLMREAARRGVRDPWGQHFDRAS